MAYIENPIMRQRLPTSPFSILVLACIPPCAISAIGMFVCIALLADTDRRDIELSHRQGMLQFEPASIQSTAVWRESDYMSAVRMLLESESDKPVVSSGFYEVRFFSECTNVQNGPQEMTYSYLNSAPSTRSGEAIEMGTITVKRSGRIDWIETQMADVRHVRVAIRRQGPADSADAALAIAEHAGGATSRAEHGDQCYVEGLLASSVNNEAWRIEYRPINYPFSFFVVDVNTKTNARKIVVPTH